MNTFKVTKTTRRPHVKWGALIIAVVCFLAEIALVVLSWYGAEGKLATDNLGVGLIAGYGWLFGAFMLLLALSYLTEDFIPSYKKYKAWKNKRNQKKKS